MSDSDLPGGMQYEPVTLTPNQFEKALGQQSA
jgi:hypothetical protein